MNCQRPILLLVAILAACDPPAAPAVPRPQRVVRAERVEAGTTAAPPEAPVDPTAAILDTDQRQLGDAVRSLVRARNPRTRARGGVMLGRLRGADVQEALGRLAHDEEPSVRRAAAWAWGQQTDAPGVTERHLLALASSDEDPETRAIGLRALGRVGTEVSEPAIVAALDRPDAATRAAACHAVGLRAVTGNPPSTRVRVAVARASLAPLDANVAAECAFALARAGADDASREPVTAAVTALLRSTDPDARSLACRAAGQLAAIPIEMLLALAEDPETRVRVAAARALGARAAGNPGAQRRALMAAFASFDASAHPLLALLEALEGHADTRLLGDLQRVAHDLTQRARRDGDHADRVLGVAHCAVARVIDRLGGRPSTVPHCGLRLLDPATVAVHHAELLATLADIPAFVRGEALLRIHRAGGTRQRVAVLTAATSIDDPRLSDLAIEALGGRDVGLIAAAADLVTAHPERFRLGADGNPRPEVVRALARALTTSHMEAQISVLHAVERIPDESLVAPLAAHLRSANDEIRRAATAAFRAIRHRDPPAGAPGPVGSPLSAETLAAGQNARAIELETSRGPVRLILEPDAAPTTVARIVSLVRQGFYDGLTFHRVVPGFVVQGGDPRGDGYGGPDWDQRCEDRPDRPYVRGTVGMALAGRDTGGSQFFVTYGRHPHLDGGYTPFAHVEQGMETLERLVPGDVIVRARVIDR